MSKKKDKQAVRLALFDNSTGYDEKQIGSQVFVKHFNGTTGKWQVAVYSEESFKRYKEYSKPKPQRQELEPWRCCICNEPVGYGPAQFLPLHRCRARVQADHQPYSPKSSAVTL